MSVIGEGAPLSCLGGVSVGCELAEEIYERDFERFLRKIKCCCRQDSQSLVRPAIRSLYVMGFRGRALGRLATRIFCRALVVVLFAVKIRSVVDLMDEG